VIDDLENSVCCFTRNISGTNDDFDVSHVILPKSSNKWRGSEGEDMEEDEDEKERVCRTEHLKSPKVISLQEAEWLMSFV